MVRGDYMPLAPAGEAGRRRVERRLAAVMGADIQAYSALMANAEEDTHRRVGAEFDHVIEVIEKNHGRVFTFAGDGLMAEFPSAAEALKCALRMQADTEKRNIRRAPERRIRFRIGINSGEIIVQGDRTGGNAVNIAARLESLAEAGGIALSEVVYEQTRPTVPAGYAFFGEHRLKNIPHTVSIYTIPAAECARWAGMPVLPRRTTPGEAFGQPAEYRPSLAVLPFRTLRQDLSDAYFAEGFVDEIIHALGALQDLLVIARSSTQFFSREPLDLRRVGHELDVRYVLHGSVRRERGSVRIMVELTEAHTGSVLWADRFEGSIDDLFDLQDSISARVATSIAPNLRDRELARALRKHPDSMSAYDLVLQALSLFHRADRASLERSSAVLNQAIAADPTYGPAFSHRAALRMRMIGQGWSGQDSEESAAAARDAFMAIERDGQDAVALAIYGHIQSYLMKDFNRAKEYLDRALGAGPNCPLAWGFSSLRCGYLGRHEDAVERAERALRLSPVGPDAARFEHYLSQAYYLSGRYEDAIAWGRMSAAHGSANNTSNLRCLIASLVAADEVEEARELTRALARLVPNFGLQAFRRRTPLPAGVAECFTERLRSAGSPE